MIKVNTGKHEMQEPHTAEECRQNDSIHAHPDTTCEHFINEGPGVDLVDFEGPGNDDTTSKEDFNNGPGVQLGKDMVTVPGVGLK